MNLIDAGRGFARAEAATMRTVFGSVTLVQAYRNFVLVGTDRRVDLAELRRRLQLHQVSGPPLAGAALDRFVGGAQVLTDDFAPVDQLLT
jgi:hypothetical protein